MTKHSPDILSAIARSAGVPEHAIHLSPLSAAPISMAEDMANRELIRDLEMHGHDDSEQVKGDSAASPHRWPPESVAYHLSEAIQEMRSFKNDRSYLLRLLNLMDEIEAQADDVGSEVYVAMCRISKWCQAQLDECEYRRVNRED